MQTTTTASGLWLVAALLPLAGCGSASSTGSTSGASGAEDLASLVVGYATEDCAFGDSSTLFLADGKWESTTRTPAPNGTYLGHMTDGRLAPDVVRRIFSGVAATLAGIRLVPRGGAEDPFPAHLCARELLLIGRTDESQWVAGDEAAVQALRPWIDELNDSLMPPR